MATAPAKPWAKADFQERLQSFRSAWFPASSGIQFNPVHAAACGWHFKESLRKSDSHPYSLSCRSCGAAVPLSSTAPRLDLSIERLQSLHQNQCPWRKLSCTFSAVFSFPAKTKTAAISYLSDRLERLLATEEILYSIERIVCDANCDMNMISNIIRLLPVDKSTTNEIILGKLLAWILHGWSMLTVHREANKDFYSLQCEYCYRTIGLWRFVDSNQRFDLRAEHRWYCLTQPAVDYGGKGTLSDQIIDVIFNAPLQSIDSFRKPADAVHFVQDLLLHPHMMLNTTNVEK